MPRVRSALGHDVYHCTGVAPVFSFVVGKHAQLGDCVDGKNGRRIAKHTSLINGWVIAVSIVHVRAIEKEVVGPASRTVHGEGSERPWRIADLIGRTCNTWIEIDELHVVPAVHRNVGNGLARKSAAHDRRGGLHLRQTFTRNFDALRNLSRSERHIDPALSGDVYDHAGGRRGLKTTLRNCDCIRADGQFRNGITAIRAGSGGALQSSVCVTHGDLSAGNYCP